jgi:hypothetical protein
VVTAAKATTNGEMPVTAGVKAVFAEQGESRGCVV